MPNRTRQLAENAILLGISAVLLFLGTYTLIGGIAVMVIPVPFILLAVRREMRDLLLIVGVFAFLGLLVTGLAGAVTGIVMALVGAVMGVLYKRGRSAVAAIAGGAGAFLAALVALLAVFSFVMNINVEEEIRMAGKMIAGFDWQIPNLPPGMTKEQYIDMQLRLLVAMLPVSFVLMCFMVSGLNHWVARLVSNRMGQPLPALPPFRAWSFPRSLIYYYFGALLLSLLFDRALMDTYWGKALLNLTYLLNIVFMIQGLSFCAFWFHRKGWKNLTPALVAALFIFHFVANILSLLGIFDLGIDLRKRLETRK